MIINTFNSMLPPNLQVLKLTVPALPYLLTTDGAQGEHACLALICDGNSRQIHLQLYTLPLLPLLTEQLLLLPEQVVEGFTLPVSQAECPSPPAELVLRPSPF